MLRSLLLLLLALLLAAPADAQRRRNPDRAPRDGFAQKGDAALTFSIDGLDAAPFEGGIGGRFWVSGRTVIATSLGFSIEAFEYDQTRWGTRFSLGAERHVGGSRRVSPFLGLGASVGYRETGYDDGVYYAESPPCDDTRDCAPYYSYPYASESSEMSIGVAGLLGAEVKLIEGVTLALAHTLGVTYVRASADPIYYYGMPAGCEGCEGGVRRPEPYPYPYYDTSSERIHVGTGTSSLTLSLYF